MAPKKRKQRIEEQIRIDGVPFGFDAVGEFVDLSSYEAVHIEYTDVVCNNLMGCTVTVHDETSPLTIGHLQSVLSSENTTQERYTGASLAQTALSENAHGTRLVYTQQAGAIYLHATKDPNRYGEWTLKHA
jgi:hypothetical protein